MRRPPSRRHSRWLVTRARHDQPRRGAHPTERARSARRQSAAAPGACIESEYSYAAVHWRGYRPRACSSGAPLTPAAFQRLGPSRTVAVERRTAGQLRPMRKACFCVLAACAAASVCADDSVATATVSVDFTAPSTPFPHYWSRCFGSGHALLTLREDWRQQVALAHQEIGVENVRFHGILDDDMATSRGPGEFSFVNVDSFGDFMTSHGMHAIIELSFMPGWLARKPNGTQHTTCAYKGITDAPSNFTQWGEVVGGLVSHLVERYGIDEIAQWKFEVWSVRERERERRVLTALAVAPARASTVVHSCWPAVAYSTLVCHRGCRNEPNTNGAINDGSPNNTATCGGFWCGTVLEYFLLSICIACLCVSLCVSVCLSVCI